MPKPKDIDTYIKNAPKESQAKLKEMRALIAKAAPKASQEIKWGMPAFTSSRILVCFAAFKKHIGFYPTPGPLKYFSKELQKFSTSKGGVQFPLDKTLPKSLITKMVKYRVKELSEKDVKWKPLKNKKSAK